MRSSSSLAASGSSTISGQNQRIHYRHPIHSLVYVTLEQGNGGIIRNLSEDGAAIQAVAPLQPHQSLRMRFDLLNPKTHLDVHAKVAWATPSGQAGLCFLDLNPSFRQHLNEWIFMNLLRGVEQAAPVLKGRDDDELILSGSVRPAIRLRPPIMRGATMEESSADILWLPWWPRPVSSRALAWAMDALILFSAVLMFFCAFLAIAQTLPSWEISLGLLAGSSGFFAALYWYLFAVMGRGTAGVRLAKIATGNAEAETCLRNQEARFR
jgi:hypothetical protein